MLQFSETSTHANLAAKHRMTVNTNILFHSRLVYSYNFIYSFDLLQKFISPKKIINIYSLTQCPLVSEDRSFQFVPVLVCLELCGLSFTSCFYTNHWYQHTAHHGLSGNIPHSPQKWKIFPSSFIHICPKRWSSKTIFIDGFIHWSLLLNYLLLTILTHQIQSRLGAYIWLQGGPFTKLSQ